MMPEGWSSDRRFGKKLSDRGGRPGVSEETTQMTEEELLHRSVEHLHGPAEIPYGEDELVVVCIVRDGRPYVRSFVDHYFSLGVKHVVFLDNRSTDGTVEALRDYDDVTVLRTNLSYKAEGETPGNGWTREVLFKQYLISRFGNRDRWCLCVDIDELFDYPYSDVLDLRSFLGYLNGKSYTAVAAQMLDMFPERPLSGRAGHSDEPLKDLHVFYDISNVSRRPLAKRSLRRGNALGNEDLESFSGGIRETLFGTDPYLTKFPLVRPDGKVKPMNGSSHRIADAAIADVSGVLLHYKFIDEHFHGQVAQAVREEHRLRGSAVYKKYSEVLESAPSLQIKQKTARKIGGVNDLLENSFLTVSEDYVERVNAAESAGAYRAGPDGPREPVDALLDLRARNRIQTLKVQRLEGRLRRGGAHTPVPGPGGRRPEGAKKGDNDLSENVRPLFVGGCARSGTTALADYLNQHPRVMVCQERYKRGVSTARITRDLFAFDRILDFRPEELERPPWPPERFKKYHAKMLGNKDPAELAWVGDKGPWYVRYMDTLTENNPGARFIIAYRPLEEVAESWNARAQDPDDPWHSHRGVEQAVEIWNAAMTETRRFIRSNPTPRVLIVSYHDFFSRHEAVVPQLSRFLGVEFDEAVVSAWREASSSFAGGRRRKETLSEEQRTYIQNHADRTAEAWVLDRISKQWDDPGLYVEHTEQAAFASLAAAEAGMWRLQQRLGDGEHDRRRSARRTEQLERNLKRERRKSERSDRHPDQPQAPESSGLLGGLRRLWTGKRAR